MKKYIGVFIGLLALFVPDAQSQKRETAHFKARYNQEAEIYAIASLELLEAVWTIATDNGFYLPQKIRFSIEKSNRNALYFNRKSLKEINWEYENLSEFLPPEKSKKNNIYGLCHEMGHLCMYNINHNRNGWMSYDYREAWADYFGNTLVDSIFQTLGTEFWPEPHNYREYAGMRYFQKRLDENNPQLQSFNNAGRFWSEIGSEIGFNHIPEFFNSIKEDKVENPGAKGKLLNVVKGYIDKQEVEEWFGHYADDLILDDEKQP